MNNQSQDNLYVIFIALTSGLVFLLQYQVTAGLTGIIPQQTLQAINPPLFGGLPQVVWTVQRAYGKKY